MGRLGACRLGGGPEKPAPVEFGSELPLPMRLMDLD